MRRKIKKWLRSVKRFLTKHKILKKKPIVTKIKTFFSRHKKAIIIVILALVTLNLLIQLFYPSARLLPGTTFSGEDFSLAHKSEAIMRLDQAYSNASIDMFFGDNETPYLSVSPADIGMSVGTTKKIWEMSYPWYMRLVPTSIFWYGMIYADDPASLNYSESSLRMFVDKQFGQDCAIKPINASLEINGTSLRLVKASDGGTCEVNDVYDAFYAMKFDNSSYGHVRIAMDVIEPDISNSDAQRLASSIGTKLLGGLSLSLGDDYGTVAVPPQELASWLEFEVVDKKLVVAINSDKSAKFFDEQVAPIVSRAAGVSIITTNNLSNVIRENGTEGKVINIKETNQRIADYLMDLRTSVDVAIQSIDPAVQYARNFDATSEGISSFIKYYVQTHNGRYGVQLIEIGGSNRQASYYPDREFNVAGASRFIVGYGILSDQDQNLLMNDATCLGKVVQYYDTSCVNSGVYNKLRQDQAYLGLNNTLILPDAASAKSTASDLATFLMRIYNGQIALPTADRDNLLNYMKSSTPRSGIASISSDVINATGSQGDQYSDVAIINSNGKAYVLAVLVEGGSLPDVINLAQQINDFMNR